MLADAAYRRVGASSAESRPRCRLGVDPHSLTARLRWCLMVELLLFAESLCLLLLVLVATAALATLAGMVVTVIRGPAD
jgi:hypothetical protein